MFDLELSPSFLLLMNSYAFFFKKKLFVREKHTKSVQSIGNVSL